MARSEDSGYSPAKQTQRNAREKTYDKVTQAMIDAGQLPTPTTTYYDPGTTQQRQSAWDEALTALRGYGAQAYGGGSGVDAGSLVGYGGSSGGGGGRGVGGGGGGLNQMYIDALKAYYAQKAGGLGNYLQPYTDAQANVGMAADQARQSITNMGAAQDKRLAEGKTAQDLYNQQLRSALTAPGASYDVGGLTRDLQAQGAGTSGLALQAQLMQQGNSDAAARRASLADALIAIRNSDLGQRGDIASQETAGFQGALDLNKLAYLAQIAKQRAAAGQQYNDQLEQLKLQLAQQGIQA